MTSFQVLFSKHLPSYHARLPELKVQLCFVKNLKFQPNLAQNILEGKEDSVSLKNPIF